MPNTTATLVTIPVPTTDSPLTAAQIDGEAKVSLRHACDTVGIDYSRQLQKLKNKSWARVGIMPTHDTTGRIQQMAMIDRRTFTMWLATIDANRVSEHARPIVEAYQAEAADALDAYFNKGAAINPRADEHQINAQIFQSRARMELLQAAKGLIHPDHLEAKARVLIAYGLGEGAELDQTRAPLYCKDFLASKNASRARISSIASQFGKKVKKAYIEATGNEPKKYPLTLPNGQTREVLAYTEADRPLLEQVWTEHFSPLTLV
ncbi:phage antirepressor N-terminal domain-containing protein [Rhodococcus sp. ARP2]|uniref:phage antirepressor N-terminal domain-containing protein n=1 Tax=Rhodococcus sp. ARP2 TaxID=1661385 RepID=UPI00064BF213|nr:phage antirepressor N-terminal domain-containing protein [Rhodococcus sp. ARP2]